MATGDKRDRPKGNLNRRKLLTATIPLVLSLMVAGAVYFTLFHGRSEVTGFRIASDQPGGDMNELLTAIAEVASKNGEGYRFEVFGNEDGRTGIELLADRTVDIAAVPADSVTRPNFALIANLVPDTYHLIVRADSGIASLHDLIGRRIAVPPQNSTAYRSFWTLIRQYGLSPERFRNVPMSDKDAIAALRDGEADALFIMLPPGDRQLIWLADAIRVRLIAIDQAEAMGLKFNALTPHVIPKGTYNGNPPMPASDVQSVATRQMLVSRGDLPDDAVRLLTAAMFENRRDLALKSRLAGFISQPETTAGTPFPLHPGAEAYFNRDQPSFLHENAEPIGVMLSIMAVLFSFFLWVKRRWEEGQKGRIDTYNLELVDLAEKARATGDAEQLAGHKAALFNMLSDVVRDLDEDRIDGEGFHYFAFTWEAVLAAVAEQEGRIGADATVSDQQREALNALRQRRAG